MREMPTASTELLARLATLQLRAPSEYIREDGVNRLVFDPPLTPEEDAVYQTLVKIAASVDLMTVALYNSIRPQMQVLRDLRQMGRNAFMALSAAERDRLIYDALTAQTIIDLAILRD